MKKKMIVSICLILAMAMIMPQAYAASSSSSANGYQASFSAITDSNELRNIPVVSGKVYQTDGVTPAANVTVQLYAWPSSDDLGKLNEGDSCARTPIGKTVSSVSGDYVLRIDPKVDIKNCWSQFGTLDCEIVTLTDTGINSTSFSIVKSDKAVEKVTSSSSEYNVTASADMIKGEVYSGLKVDLKMVPRSNNISSNLTNNVVQPMDGYSEVLGTIYPAQWVNVGNILIGSNGYTEEFTYSQGASSVIGVGFSMTGQYGSFSASGSISRSSTTSVIFPSYSSPTARFLDTQYTFGLWTCFPGDGTWYFLCRAHQFAGGTQVTRLTSIPSSTTWKNSYSAGSQFIKETGTATNWSDGARTGPAIGINLTAQCGYSSNSKLKYTFTSAGYLYGETNYAPQTNGRIWVKST